MDKNTQITAVCQNPANNQETISIKKQQHVFFQPSGKDLFRVDYHPELNCLVKNWRKTKELRIIKKVIYITRRAFDFVPELMHEQKLQFKIIYEL